MAGAATSKPFEFTTSEEQTLKEALFEYPIEILMGEVIAAKQ